MLLADLIAIHTNKVSSAAVKMRHEMVERLRVATRAPYRRGVIDARRLVLSFVAANDGIGSTFPCGTVTGFHFRFPFYVLSREV